MQDFIIRSNIDRFKALIETEHDLGKLHILMDLLAEEIAKLQRGSILPFKIIGSGDDRHLAANHYGNAAPHPADPGPTAPDE